jgi:hypothetical protein
MFPGDATPSSRSDRNPAARASQLHLPEIATGSRRCTILFFTVLTARALLSAATPPPPSFAPRHYAEVTLDPAETPIYVGKVRLAMLPFTRRANGFTSDYTIKVFPFFFFNEQGRISIEFSDAQLQQLERGEPADLKGQAINSSGAGRRIEGHAVPDAVGSDHGKIKVKVSVSKNIELVFNTSYRLTGKE